jgi:hypothetical protein
MWGNGQPIPFSKQGKLHQAETDRKVCHRRRDKTSNLRSNFYFQVAVSGRRRDRKVTMDGTMGHG